MSAILNRKVLLFQKEPVQQIYLIFVSERLTVSKY